jgi:hypothetical protein
MTATLSTGARYLKRGDTFDPEDFRMTHRLRVAGQILSGLGITPEWEHGGSFTNELGKHVCCDKCKASWPEWVTDEVFNRAFALANEVQTERGAFNQRAAYAGKAAREKAEREAREAARAADEDPDEITGPSNQFA